MSLMQTFDQISGQSFTEIHNYTILILGGLFWVGAAVIIGCAIYQLMDGHELSYFTFILIVMLTIICASMFTLFIT